MRTFFTIIVLQMKTLGLRVEARVRSTYGP